MRDRILRLSFEVLGDDGGGAYHRVLLDETTPQRMAEVRGERIQAVRSRVAKLRSAVTRDEVLYDLMRARRD